MERRQDGRSALTQRGNVPILAAIALAAGLLSCSLGVGEDQGVDFEAASELVLEHISEAEGLADRSLIVFGLQEPLQPGDRLAPYTTEDYPGPAEPYEPDEPTWFFWIDYAPSALFVHPTQFVFVRQSDGELIVQDQEWWPVLNGQGLWLTEEEYWDRSNWVYSTIDGASDEESSHGQGARLASRMPAFAEQDGGQTVGIVLNGWRPGQRLQDMFEIDSNAVHDALTDSGFDVTYFGPVEDDNPDRDGTFEFDNYDPWFLEKSRELKAGDTLFVYLTGHGFVGREGNGFAGPMGEDLLVNVLERFDPGVHIIVLVQACESGAFLDGLRTVADVAVVTTSNLDPAYNDIDTGQVDRIEGVDPNDDDVGSEFVSGFVETWNEIRADPTRQQEAADRASQQGTNLWEEVAAMSFIGAVEKDLTAQAGITFPSLVRGDPSTRPEPTATAPPDDSQANAQTFGDGAGDATLCSTGDPIEDPYVDILEYTFSFEPGSGGLVEIVMARSPLESFEHYSYSVQARVGHDGAYRVGIYEIHADNTLIGELESSSEVAEGTEGNVGPTKDSVIFRFPGYQPTAGDTVTARSFHMETDSAPHTCDVTQASEIDLSLIP